MPVMTHPIRGVSWNMCVTVLGSISLSCILKKKGEEVGSVSVYFLRKERQYRDFPLRDDHGAVGAAHPDARQAARIDRLEGILCCFSRLKRS